MVWSNMTQDFFIRISTHREDELFTEKKIYQS